MDTVRRHHPAMGGDCGGPTSLRCSSSPAQEFAALASVFRQRLVVGTTMAAAVGAYFGASSSSSSGCPRSSGAL
ncbi:hypothetical protein ACQJBY_032043 [Aegilops geniculata]